MHTTGFETTGAHHHFFRAAIGYRADALKIGVEASFGDIMGMTDVAADQRFFSTNFTHLGHVKPSWTNGNQKKTFGF
jgi:hypothetical protein